MPTIPVDPFPHPAGHDRTQTPPCTLLIDGVKCGRTRIQTHTTSGTYLRCPIHDLMEQPGGEPTR